MEHYTRAIGKTHQETRKIFSAMCDFDPTTYNAIEARFWELDRDYINRMGPPKKPGLLSLLRTLQERNVPCALASSTRTARVIEHLEAAQLTDYFQVVIGGDQAPTSKPAPDIFLLAATHLDQPAHSCLVLEDSFAGVQAGRSAGMHVVMVPDILQPTPEIRGKADRVLESLSDVEELIITNKIIFTVNNAG